MSLMIRKYERLGGSNPLPRSITRYTFVSYGSGPQTLPQQKTLSFLRGFFYTYNFGRKVFRVYKSSYKYIINVFSILYICIVLAISYF
jgi:hypothetical protein